MDLEALAVLENNYKVFMPNRKKRSTHNNNHSSPPLSLEAKTDNQKRYIKSIVENDVTVCCGPAGTGKSFISAGIAAEHLYQKKIEQIVVTRPLVCTGKDIGSMPGFINDKIKPYLMPMEENFRLFFGNAQYGAMLQTRKVRYEPLETMRGATFHHSYMILDEAQNCTLDQIKMFITRMGEGSKVIINGDVKQTDLHNRSGLQTCIDKIGHIDEVGIISLTYEDIQRHSVVGKILIALD